MYYKCIMIVLQGGIRYAKGSNIASKNGLRIEGTSRIII